MTYKEFIESILNTRGRVINESCYKEIHHILPRCKGGLDTDDNLVELHPKEHFIAHKLLAEENPHDQALTYAYWAMCTMNKNNKNQERYILTPEEYEEARISTYESRKGRPLSEETKKKISAKAVGRKPTEETRKKLSSSLKKAYSNPELREKIGLLVKESLEDPEVRNKISVAMKGRVMTEEHKQHIGEANRGRKRSDEAKQKMSAAKKGKPWSDKQREVLLVSFNREETKMKHRILTSKRFKGKPKSEEHKQKIREALQGEKSPMWGTHLSDDVKVKISNSLKGRAPTPGSTGMKWYNNGVVDIFLKPDEEIPPGFKRGRLPKERND